MPYRSANATEWRGGRINTIAAPGGRAGVERSLLLMLMLQRVLAAMDLLSSDAPHPPAVYLVVAAAWNVCLLVIAGRHGRLSGWIVAIDVGLAVVLLAMAAGTGQDDWAYMTSLCAATMAGAALSLVATAVAVSVLSAAFVGEILVRKNGHAIPALAGDLGLILLLAALAWFVANATRTQSRRAEQADSAPAALVRDLHDTALATLSAIARGQVDHHSQHIRSRAAQDVVHIRSLLLGESAGSQTPLGARLREVVAAAELLGLRVHWQGGVDSADLPQTATAALADATREALNNVTAHAGTAECWLTLMADRGRVTVRVVDRGCGFDPAACPPGFGLGRSLPDRMAACGGAARVTSAPGSGTCVELVWPKLSTWPSWMTTACSSRACKRGRAARRTCGCRALSRRSTPSSTA